VFAEDVGENVHEDVERFEADEEVVDGVVDVSCVVLEGKKVDYVGCVGGGGSG